MMKPRVDGVYRSSFVLCRCLNLWTTGRERKRPNKNRASNSTTLVRLCFCGSRAKRKACRASLLWAKRRRGGAVWSSLTSTKAGEFKTKLKINHWRSSPGPPELAGFYVDSHFAAATFNFASGCPQGLITGCEGTAEIQFVGAELAPQRTPAAARPNLQREPPWA